MYKDIQIEGIPSCLTIAPGAGVVLLSAQLPASSIQYSTTKGAVQRVYIYTYPGLKLLHEYSLPNFKQSDLCVDIFRDIKNSNPDENSNTEGTKNNQNEKKIFHRCCLSKDGKYAVIGEENGISREYILNVQDGGFVQKNESAFTLIIKDYKPFVSFSQNDYLTISILRPCKDIHSDKVVLAKMSRAKVGKRMLGKPIVMGSNNHVLFMQINFQGQPEVCVYDISLDEEAIVCRSNYQQMNIPKNHKITNVYLNELENAVWFYYEHMDGKQSSGACLWRPQFNDAHSLTSGEILGQLRPQGELFPLIPAAVESDFFRIITKPNYSSRSKSIPLFEWRDELTMMYKCLFDSWIRRHRHCYDVNDIVLETIYQGKYAIIYCPLINSLYAMNWSTGFLNFKVKFKQNKPSHIFIHDDKILIVFQDGRIILLEANESHRGALKLELVCGRFPEGTKCKDGEDFAAITPRGEHRKTIRIARNTSRTCTIL